MADAAADNHAQYGNANKLAARARLHQLYSEDDEPWFGFVARQAGRRPGDRVLDIGCGPGWFWANSANAVPDGIDLTLADLSDGMVAEALKRVGGLGRAWTVTGTLADAAALPFADNSFDVVIAMHMLYHVPGAEQAVAEAARVLKPGGRYLVTTNGIDNLRGLYEVSGKAFGVAGSDPAAAIFGFAEAERLLAAGFGNVERHDHPGRLRITDPEHVFAAQTSYPPGDGAPAAQLAALRTAIAEAFAAGGGMLEVEKQVGVFVSRKPG